jgi:hypothetical protein
VAAPPNLVAELTVPEARRLWSSLRKLGGSRAESLPSSFELALFSAVDLPARAVGFVKPETPIVGVLVASPGAEPSGVFGVRTVRGSDLVAELTRREGATFRAVTDGSPVTVLASDRPSPALGVVDDWLLVAHDEALLRAAGPYVARGLALRRPPEAPLTLEMDRAALAGPLLRAMKERWASVRAGLGTGAEQARLAHGRPADFGDPAAILALADQGVGALFDYVASARRVRATVRPVEDHLEVSLSLSAEPGGALAASVAELEVGSLEPLLALPRGVLVAGLSRSSESERSSAAENPADTLRSVLGPRLSEKDAAPLAEALRSYQRGSGAVTLLGTFSGGSIFLKQEARDPKELDRGFLGLLRALRAPALSEPLEPLFGKISPKESETHVSGIEGSVHRVELSRASPASKGTEVLVRVHDGVGIAALGADAGPALLALASERPVTLKETPGFGKLAEGRAPAALSLYADFSVMKPTGVPAPALAVIGKKNGEALLEVVLSAPACALVAENLGTP